MAVSMSLLYTHDWDISYTWPESFSVAAGDILVITGCCYDYHAGTTSNITITTDDAGVVFSNKVALEASGSGNTCIWTASVTNTNPALNITVTFATGFGVWTFRLVKVTGAASVSATIGTGTMDTTHPYTGSINVTSGNATLWTWNDYSATEMTTLYPRVQYPASGTSELDYVYTSGQATSGVAYNLGLSGTTNVGIDIASPPTSPAPLVNVAAIQFVPPAGTAWNYHVIQG